MNIFNLGKKNTQTVRIIMPRPETPPVNDEGPSVPAGMWEKCLECGAMVYAEDLQSNLKVCSHCGYHFRLTARQRVLITADESTFKEFSAEVSGGNPLGFPGYDDKLRNTRAFTGLNDAIITGTARVKGHPCVLTAMDSNFMMGSMGAVVGEKMAAAAEKALAENIPLVSFTVSGGARMQEGMISLMQMAKVSAAIRRLDEAGLLYLVILTDPTTGGVTASFAMLGDITLAEPKALIGFAGRRVIEQTTNQSIPSWFQRSEFLLEKGFIDRIVPREEMADVIGSILALHERRRP